MPYLTAFAQFRDGVRQVAREQKGNHGNRRKRDKSVDYLWHCIKTANS